MDGSVSRKYGGTGLGLSISKELINILGGEIQVDSVEGQGSIFRCLLPFEKREVKAVPSYAQQQERAGIKSDFLSIDPALNKNPLKGKCLLIVDDDLKNTLSLSMVLKRYELGILTAENGEVALQKLEANPQIDLILTDLMMPIKDGYETIKSVKSMKKYEKLPVVVLTANTAPDIRARCLNLGATDLLTKPIDIERLVSLLETSLAV